MTRTRASERGRASERAEGEGEGEVEGEGGRERRKEAGREAERKAELGIRASHIKSSGNVRDLELNGSDDSARQRRDPAVTAEPPTTVCPIKDTTIKPQRRFGSKGPTMRQFFALEGCPRE